jgi:hypothetical protein
LRYRIPALNRLASPAGALLVLNAAAVVGLYKFMFTRGPLSKIWNSGKPGNQSSTSKIETILPPERATVGAGIDGGKSS